jgi:hypothetical protein
LLLSKGTFHYATALGFQPKDGEETLNLEHFLDQSVKGQCEGLVVKTLDDVYEPSRQSLHWLKLKNNYFDGLSDSVDLVPLGAYKGRGKRTTVYGATSICVQDWNCLFRRRFANAGGGAFCMNMASNVGLAFIVWQMDWNAIFGLSRYTSVGSQKAADLSQ